MPRLAYFQSQTFLECKTIRKSFANIKPFPFTIAKFSASQKVSYVSRNYWVTCYHNRKCWYLETVMLIFWSRVFFNMDIGNFVTSLGKKGQKANVERYHHLEANIQMGAGRICREEDGEQRKCCPNTASFTHDCEIHP